MKEKNRKIKNIQRGLALLILLFAFAMVLPEQVNAAPKLNKKTITLLKGKKYTLKLKGTKKKAKWKTSAKKVAKISNKKKTSVKITAKKVGKATVSAKVGKKTYKCRVTVVDPKLNKTKLTLTAGDGYQLQVSGGTRKVVWKTSNSGVVTVVNGRVTAKSAGTATIRAVQNKRKMTCVVQVKAKSGPDKGSEPEAQSESGQSDQSGQRVRRVWVVTKEAYIEFMPVYDEVGYIECLTCGETFEGEGMGEAYDKHESDHMDNGEEGRYTVKSRKTLIREDRIDHPEEGYWKEEYDQ